MAGIPLTPELREANLEELHVVTVKLANAMEDRDDAILEAHRDGLSTAEIAATTNLTRQRVWQIINA